MIDPSRPPGQSEQFVVGGQISDYPAHTVVSPDLALRAARGFYQTAQFAAEGTSGLIE